MAFGYFEVVEPGHAYVGRLSYDSDLSTLPADPMNVACPIEGEWVTVNASNKIIRPSSSTTPTLANTVKAFPLLVDKSRTDVQSNNGKRTVLAHKGAICRTSVFATLEGDDTTALTYAFGTRLVIASFLDDNLNTRVGLAPSTGVTTGAGGTVAGALTGWFSSSASNPVAQVIRAPYTLHGVGVGSRRQVMDIEIL